MAEFKLPENSIVKEGKIHACDYEHENEIVELKIYRFDPDSGNNPTFDIFQIPINKVVGNMVLDYLLYIKDSVDTSLAFRKSCREGVCGSCAMNINGTNRLACTTRIQDFIGHVLPVLPLPSMFVVRDLIVNLSGAFKQYASVKPWISRKENAQDENIQLPQERARLDGLWDCILCFSCTTSCPSYWWNGQREGNSYLGPAVLLQAYRWIADTRDNSKKERLKFLKDTFRLYRCQTILNCTSVCPKGLNPGHAIANIKKDMITTDSDC